MKIRLVVFDMAGTTVEDDRYVHKALVGACKDYKVAITEEEANGVMGFPKPVAIRELLKKHYPAPAIISQTLITEIHENFVSRMIDFYENEDNVREKKGAAETFMALRKNNIKIAVDTGFDRKIADAIIKRLGWNDLIDVSIASDEVGNGRPYPDMIFKAMEMVGVKEPNEVAKVGDTASDIQQGKKAACGFVIGVTTGAYEKEALEAERPTHLIEDLTEVLGIFQLQEGND